ncbi:MAG: glycosyltransferase involved in cell wall biosynthesis [Bacteroidia bacterium]|jgi:glycosyltransferase involved in cell wall biosynthesis
MRIGFDAKRYFHNQTGLGNYARTLVNGFIKMYPEHACFLFDTKPPEHFDFPAKLISKKKSSMFWRQFGISKDINRNKIDLYHGLSAELPYTRPKKTKMVVTIHDLIFMKFPQYYKTIDRKIYAHKTDNALRSADAVIATSQQTKNDLLELMPDDDIPIHVIYQDCNPMYYLDLGDYELEKIRTKYGLPKEYLVCVSKFEQRKNHLALLQAIMDLPSDYAQIVLIGKPGDTFTQVKDFISKNNLGSRVIVLSDVPTQDLPKIYQMAQASIFPSLYEGFGIPVVESLVSGTPVITCADSCMQEIAEDAAIYFNPTDIPSITQALTSFDQNGISNKLEAAIPNRLEQFRNLVILSEHNSLYQRICSQ